jgi:hypothetical protein
LAAFTRFFLETCLDQVTFMEELMEPNRLRTRILLRAEEETRLGQIRSKAGQVLEAVLYRGELPRGDVASLLGSGGRHARRIVAELSKVGVLTSDTSKAPLRLAFPATLVSRWMPGPLPRANALTLKGNAVQRRSAPRQRRCRRRRPYRG